jgi:alkylation response protein AidB-like acyl-CoA dehydrogenase
VTASATSEPDCRPDPPWEDRRVTPGLSEEHEALRRSVEEFARDVVAPQAEHADAAREFPYDVVRQMGTMGLFGLPFPEELGGMGGDFLALCLAIEELARVDSSVAITLEAAVGLGSMPIFRYGTDEQRKELLPPLCRGEQLAAFGLTEPGGGSDAGHPRTKAELDGDEWVVNGTKAFITNAGTDISSLVTVLCRTGERAEGRPELTSILVPVPRDGFSASEKYDKVGWHASDTRELSFDDCRVPAENVLGERGSGYAQFLATLDEGRIAISALAVGLAQGCVDESVRYAREREAFGSPIGSFQAVAFRIADMEMRTQVARCSYRAAAALLVAGLPVKREAAIAKLYSSTIAVDNARDATQVFGGYGFMNEYAVARHWRDSKILEIGEGTSEIQRMVIARELGL